MSTHVFLSFKKFASAELNQRALVGKSVAVVPGIADETAEQAINATRRYSVILTGNQISRYYFHSTLNASESISFCVLSDHVSFSFRFVEFVTELEVKQNRVPGKY